MNDRSVAITISEIVGDAFDIDPSLIRAKAGRGNGRNPRPLQIAKHVARWAMAKTGSQTISRVGFLLGGTTTKAVHRSIAAVEADPDLRAKAAAALVAFKGGGPTRGAARATTIGAELEAMASAGDAEAAWVLRRCEARISQRARQRGAA